jgi:hypothetical protein
MDEYQSFLGSAAVGAAAALVGAGGHSPAKEKRRASSARRAASKPGNPEDRSRSPGDSEPDKKSEVVERAILAPQYIEPGTEGDALGVEGRHRHNMQKLFGYLAHMEKVVNDHAAQLDGVIFEQRSSKRSTRKTALEFKAFKAGLVQTNEECQILANVVEANDCKLKMDFAESMKGIWGFLETNNVGIMGLFQEADAALNKVKLQTEVTQKHLEETKAADGARPSEIAAGPKGLAFVGLRAEMKKLDGKVEDLKAQMTVVRAEANVAATAAGAKVPTPPGMEPAAGDADSFAQLILLEEAMEDRFAVMQVQLKYETSW